MCVLGGAGGGGSLGALLTDVSVLHALAQKGWVGLESEHERSTFAQTACPGVVTEEVL